MAVDFKAIKQRFALEALPQELQEANLELMETSGLAHDHVILEGTAYLLRLPKQSQMKLDIYANLAYQTACFERAVTSGHTPKLYYTFKPDDLMPYGGFLVERIYGRSCTLPKDLPSLIDALSALHAVKLPHKSQRSPLLNLSEPAHAMIQEIQTQATFLDKIYLHKHSVTLIQNELRAAQKDMALLNDLPRCFISFDAHPGNFIIQKDKKAILVDLEKCRYSLAGFDLAHATLYTSTTWDRESFAVLNREHLHSAYQQWLDQAPRSLSALTMSHLMKMRRMMWLWSVTWCAKWLSLHDKPRVEMHGENWSSQLNTDSLNAHIYERTTHYLRPDIIENVIADWYDF